MFNWYSPPTFVATLLFCALASYVLTRSQRGLIPLTAVATQAAAASYLLGQGMLANAATLADWESWARATQWGIVAALVLGYWLTVLVIKQPGASSVSSSLRRIADPVGILVALGGMALVVSTYLGDSLYEWSAPTHLPEAASSYFRYRVPVGPLYAGFVALVWASTLGAARNVWRGWRSLASVASGRQTTRRLEKTVAPSSRMRLIGGFWYFSNALWRFSRPRIRAWVHRVRPDG